MRPAIPLTPVEAQVLGNPDGIMGSDVMRTALLHLFMLRALHLVRVSRKTFLGAKLDHRLRVEEGAIPLPEPLEVVRRCLRADDPPDQTLAMRDAVYRLQREFGGGYTGYLKHHLRPALIERGLLAAEEYRWLGLIRRTRHRHTAAGAWEAERVETRLRSSWEIPQLLKTDPAAAVAAAAALGSLLLIDRKLHRHFKALAAAARAGGAGATLPPELPFALDDEEQRMRWVEMLEALNTIDLSGVLETVDGLSDAGDGGGDGDGGGGE